jgi:hypothetical protein
MLGNYRMVVSRLVISSIGLVSIYTIVLIELIIHFVVCYGITLLSVTGNFFFFPFSMLSVSYHEIAMQSVCLSPPPQTISLFPMKSM